MLLLQLRVETTQAFSALTSPDNLTSVRRPQLGVSGTAGIGG